MLEGTIGTMRLGILYFLLAACAIAEAKNSLPRQNIEKSDPNHVLHYSGHASRHSGMELSKDHVFHDNYQSDFSWDYERLQDRLWRGQSKQKRDIAKRAPAGATVLGTVIKLPSCAGCIKQAITGEQASLNTLTSDYFKTAMLLTQSQLLDRCVFYTSVEAQEDANARWFLGGAAEHPSLSKIATDWANGNGNNLVTIWNLYTGANDVTGAQDNPQYYNYWEVYTPGSWLNNLLDGQGTQFKYFAAMSTASKKLYNANHFPFLYTLLVANADFLYFCKPVAEQCGGTVYVMSCSPKDLKKFGRIWAENEWPALKNNYL